MPIGSKPNVPYCTVASQTYEVVLSKCCIPQSSCYGYVVTAVCVTCAIKND